MNTTDTVIMGESVSLRVARPTADVWNVRDFILPNYTVQLGWQKASYVMTGDQL